MVTSGHSRSPSSISRVADSLQQGKDMTKLVRLMNDLEELLLIEHRQIAGLLRCADIGHESSRLYGFLERQEQDANRRSKRELSRGAAHDEQSCCVRSCLDDAYTRIDALD